MELKQQFGEQCFALIIEFLIITLSEDHAVAMAQGAVAGNTTMDFEDL
ncbi:hypothetical protein X011_26475 [Mycobacterium tuberculosis variant microti OV254]|nr:hypothetical protein X011_26475 [Mycobacterium tuberculosis variant microti OV254]